jgi:hypothetical protein
MEQRINDEHVVKELNEGNNSNQKKRFTMNDFSFDEDSFIFVGYFFPLSHFNKSVVMMMISFFTIGSPFDSILSSFVSLIVHS